MQNARKLVSIAESIPCDVELCYGRYVVNAKSMLGVLSMPEFDGESFIYIQIMRKNARRSFFSCLIRTLLWTQEML